jgi:predicted Rdx family selenoprotein
LKEATGVEAKLLPDRNGIFDVFVDESLIFSLSEAGRFPEPGEIVAMFKQ